MKKRSKAKGKTSRPFYDGAIDIKRWKARKRAERFVENVGQRTLRLVGALLLALPVVTALIVFN